MPSLTLPLPLSTLSKPFNLAPSFTPPTLLTFQTLTAVPLSRTHLAEDLTAVNSSLSLIRRTRGGSWASAPLTEEYNYLDLCWHEREFRDRDSFAYAVYQRATDGSSEGKAKTDGTDAERGSYVGCFYLYPMGTRTKLSETNARYDVDVSWWVTEDAYERGAYRALFEAVQGWVAKDFDCFGKVWCSNAEIPGQGAGDGGK